MKNTAFFVLSIAVNLVVYWTVATWYVRPWLDRQPIARALAPLLLVHALRTMGTVFMIPEVTGSVLPPVFAVPGVVGDLLAAVLGALGLVALSARSRWAIVLAWALSIEGLVDFASALTIGARLEVVARYHLGPAWFIPTFMVPFFTVAHLLAIGQLRRRGAELRAWLRAPGAHSAPSALAGQGA